MSTASLKKFFNIPVLALLLLLIYAVGGKQPFTSKQISASALQPSSEALNSSSQSCRVKLPRLTARLNVRSRPNGAIVGTLKNEDAVTNEGREGDWVKTNRGYIYGEYISC